MLKSVAYAKEKYRFFGPKMTKWAHVDLRQEKQCFGRCFFGQKLIIGSENWDWGGGPKRYVFHSKSTCGHFVTFGQKSIAFSVMFYTTFQHGAVWWLFVQKVMLQTFVFLSQIDFAKKWNFHFLQSRFETGNTKLKTTFSWTEITKCSHVEKCCIRQRFW